jgi:hypothetical protein
MCAEYSQIEPSEHPGYARESSRYGDAQVREQGTIHVQLGDMGGVIQRLQELASALGERLQVVMANEEPMKDAGAPPSKLGSPLAEMIFNHKSAVASCCERLEEILRRLDT